MNDQWLKTNNGVKWRWFIVSKKVEQINDYLFIDYKSNKINIGMNYIRVNDNKMSIRWNNDACSIPEISVLNHADSLGEYRLRRKRTVKEMGF